MVKHIECEIRKIIFVACKFTHLVPIDVQTLPISLYTSKLSLLVFIYTILIPFSP